MQQKLSANGRRMVTIVDPHIKRDNGYYIYKEVCFAVLLFIQASGVPSDVLTVLFLFHCSRGTTTITS